MTHHTHTHTNTAGEMVHWWYNEDAGRYTLLAYSIFLLGGGLAAYYRRGSRVSLVSSSLSAFLLLVAFVLSFWWPIIAFAIGAIVSLNLAINFAVRLQATRKCMPAGILMLVSLCVFAFLVYLAARAPVKGLPDYRTTRSREEVPRHALTLPAVGLAPEREEGGGEKITEGGRPAQPEPQPGRLRLRRRRVG
jgi:uncharacterized membrane protein (UPF0136 family)